MTGTSSSVEDSFYIPGNSHGKRDVVAWCTMALLTCWQCVCEREEREREREVRCYLICWQLRCIMVKFMGVESAWIDNDGYRGARHGEKCVGVTVRTPQKKGQTSLTLIFLM